MITSLTDYENGEVKIIQDSGASTDLQLTIDKYEPKYLNSLLGCDLYKELKADLDANGGVPSEPRFIAIYEAFCMDYDCGIIESVGIKEMLTFFIYFEYTRKHNFNQTVVGSVRTENETADNVGFSSTNGYEIYNQGIETFNAIQFLICDNPNGYDYESFNGQRKRKSSWL